VDPDQLMAQYADSRLALMTLTWREQGLLGRFLTQQARQQRIPEARLREQWAQMALGMPIPGQPAARPGPQGRGQPTAKASEPDPFAPMREALAAFIRRPGTLEITLRPPKPVPFADMAGFAGQPPAETVQRLGLSVVAR
jgi:hypothetical protein